MISFWKINGIRRTPTSILRAVRNGSPPIPGGAESDTSPTRRPTLGKSVTEALPAIVRSRPVAFLTCAMSSRRIISVGGAIMMNVTAATATASSPMPP